MRQPMERLMVLLGLLVTATWPMLLGGMVAGREGIVFGALVYLLFGALFVSWLVVGGIRRTLRC